jgi:hypothetical protein
MHFSNYRDNFDPETLAILESAFDEAWGVLTISGGTFDQEATRNALADLIMSFASEGETDPKRLKELALAALPRTLQTIEKEAPPWLIEVADSVLKAHVDTEQKFLDAAGLKSAIVKALSDAYERGLEDGLATKVTGPDA